MGEAHSARAHGTERGHRGKTDEARRNGRRASAWASQRTVLGQPHPGAGLVGGGEEEIPDGVSGGWDVAVVPAWPGVFQALPSSLRFLSSVR